MLSSTSRTHPDELVRLLVQLLWARSWAASALRHDPRRWSREESWFHLVNINMRSAHKHDLLENPCPARALDMLAVDATTRPLKNDEIGERAHVVDQPASARRSAFGLCRRRRQEVVRGGGWEADALTDTDTCVQGACWEVGGGSRGCWEGEGSEAAAPLSRCCSRTRCVRGCAVTQNMTAQLTRPRREGAARGQSPG